jgi:hypothetical protein
VEFESLMITMSLLLASHGFRWTCDYLKNFSRFFDDFIFLGSSPVGCGDRAREPKTKEDMNLKILTRAITHQTWYVHWLCNVCVWDSVHGWSQWVREMSQLVPLGPNGGTCGSTQRCRWHPWFPNLLLFATNWLWSTEVYIGLSSRCQVAVGSNPEYPEFSLIRTICTIRTDCYHRWETGV